MIHAHLTSQAPKLKSLQCKANLLIKPDDKACPVCGKSPHRLEKR